MTPHRPTTTSSPATVAAGPFGAPRFDTALDHTTPATNAAADAMARQIRCRRLGSGLLSGSGTRLKTLSASGSGLEATGAPQPTQASALSLIVRPHSVHLTRAIEPLYGRRRVTAKWSEVLENLAADAGYLPDYTFGHEKGRATPPGGEDP